ncbi:metal-sulfur cluster assembly factor [Candidatus Palauibacter scopulicola]|uniref:metal-sulfur cluster assembly factor n=1 Tax=Candidatus Palauibacter scopulicola TaxID=3056741 RepID=UPI0028737006|nr:metal-sulfur cluster assembly factor [Candidatus Palauibacter scopulicola]
METKDTGDTRDPMDGMGSADEASGVAPEIEEQVRTALRTVTDPELGINIVDLGLVYDVEVEEGEAKVTMTLTSPGCPAGGQILGGAKDAAETVDGVEEAVVSLVWKPFWTPERIDPAVRAMMGF